MATYDSEANEEKSLEDKILHDECHLCRTSDALGNAAEQKRKLCECQRARDSCSAIGKTEQKQTSQMIKKIYVTIPIIQ